MDEMQEFAKNLGIESPKDDPSKDGFFTLQHWYPRIWDEWGRDKDFVVPHELDTDLEDSIDISDLQDLRVRFRSLLPTFAQKFGYHGEPRCANEVSFRFYGTDEFIAEVFPKSSGKEFDRAISGLTSYRKDWRVGRNGLVKLVRDEFSETREIPFSEKLFFAWLKDLGWDAKQSAPGILAKQIHKKLEGHSGVLRNEKFLGLLEHMNGGLVKQNGSPVDNNKINQERELSVGEVKSRLVDKTRRDLHEYLLSKGIFRLGIRARCPHCTRNPWFLLEEIKDTMVCPKCLNTFPAIGNVDSATWCYKTAGPFSVPNYAEGAYAVLLTADFFDDHKLTAIRMTSALSFVAKANGKKDLEADMAAFWETSIYGEKQSGILFAECKTYGVFEKRDFDRMRYLAKTFPGAVLVFSTLRKQLTPKEIKDLTRITKAGRKHWKTERPINPVLILTGTELLNFSGPPYCWDEATRKKFDRYRGLISLCDATQQIYLGLPSWQSEWQKKWEMQHQKRLAKRQTKPKGQ
ncbi:MAG TPA: hypothetical protein VM144_02785 [Aestuariivirga sp.]|nr:hypothetical protein [Aestuariivirga sp.]